jgi:hypothetical protein
MTSSEQLIHTTIRIECDTPSGVACGTGFFFKFDADEGKSFIPVIVTNKHVVKNSTVGRLVFSLCDSDGNYVPGRHHTYHINNFEKPWIFHPDEDVDLCVMPIHQLYKEYKPNPYNLYVVYISEDNIPTETEIASFSHIEDLTIVGYPDGLWDNVNNLPLVRRGITASSIHFDFQGHPHFVMDASIFGGSSGSPVFIYNDSHYMGPKGLVFGTRIRLVGINRAVYLHPVTGEITEINSMDTSLGKTAIQMPNNLGLAIHARKLLDFKSLL